METITAVQDFEYVELSNLISKVSDLKAEGYRLVQICGVVLDDETYEILYSFDKDHLLKNLRLDVKIDVDGRHSSMRMKSTTCSVYSSTTVS